MYLEEFATSIEQNLNWTYEHDCIPYKRRYTVAIDNTFFKDRTKTIKVVGEGITPENAKDDYIRKIHGRKIHSVKGTTKVYTVPSNIEG